MARVANVAKVANVASGPEAYNFRTMIALVMTVLTDRTGAMARAALVVPAAKVSPIPILDLQQGQVVMEATEALVAVVAQVAGQHHHPFRQWMSI